MKNRLVPLLLAPLVGAGALSASDLGGTETALLIPSVLAPGDNAGYSVALDADTLAVGVPRHDAQGNQSGAAFVFVRDGAGWSEQAMLVGSHSDNDDGFGTALALEGDRLVVGAAWKAMGGGQRGEAYVFERAGDVWNQRGRLIASNGDANDFFGTSVTLSGDRVVVGADGAADYRGSAYVFELTGGQWVETQELTPELAGTNQLFGTSVDLDGDALVVGAPWANHTTPEPYDRPGAAYVFRHDGSGFVREASLFAPTDGSYWFVPEWLGQSVAISGDVLVAGSPRSANSNGLAFVFERVGGAWGAGAPLVSALGNRGFAGEAVDIEGDTIALGAPLYDPEPGPGWEGAVSIWQRQASGWSERRMLRPRLGALTGQMGAAVALQGETVLAGARWDNTFADNAGAVHVYEVSSAPGELFCFGDGSGTSCPCNGNNSTPGGAGCRTSLFGGGVCAGVGTTSVSADDLVIAGCRLIPGQAALLFHGTEAIDGGAGAPFGKGLRCVGGTTVRVGVRVPDSAGGASWEGLAASQGFTAGDTGMFQVWFRDPSTGCGNGFNLTNAYRVVFES